MEVKINKEIREYTESMFFGLSMRQFIFAILGCGVAVAIYFGLREPLGTETVSWMCMLGAAPFIAVGFLKYHGMNAEKVMLAWLKSEFLIPKKMSFKSENYYYDIMKKTIENHEKEVAACESAIKARPSLHAARERWRRSPK